MDKRSVLAFILIGIVVVIWLFIASIQRQEPHQTKPQDKKENIQKSNDSQPLKEVEKPYLSFLPDSIKNNPEALKKINEDSLKYSYYYGKFFSKSAYGKNDTITIETDSIIAKISTKGAALIEWQLKGYNMARTKQGMVWPVQLIWWDSSQVYLKLKTTEGKSIDTRDLYFSLDSNTKNYYNLKENDSIVITAQLKIDSTKSITKIFTFYGGKYHFNLDIKFNNLDQVLEKNALTLQNHQLVWSGGLRYQEQNTVDESNEAQAIRSLNKTIKEFDDPYNVDTLTGLVDFAALKVKYFTIAFIPEPLKSYNGNVAFSGYKETNLPEGGIIERFNMAFPLEYNGKDKTQSFKIYIGPLKYEILEEYGLADIINFGWRIIIRPIGEFFMLPIFKLIYKIVPNYGLAIIIFSLIIKLLLYPLSIKQLRSAQRMQLITPEMNRIREEYKDDKQKQQQEIMKMYSQYGINPMGGCLPLLLQLPILYALWAVLSKAIELRQTEFILWIHDLSIPDVILSLPFRIPLLNINQFSGLALLMGITLFLQQKMTITDPRQKSLVYIMPIMFTLMFSNLPSGLNLYYFMFNLMGIVQQVYINKYSKNKLTLDDLKRMPKKEGWFQRKMREAQEIAAAQGRTLPGQNLQSNKPKYQRKKQQPKGKTNKK